MAAQAVIELIAKTDKWDGGIRRAQSGFTNFLKTQGGLHNAMANNNKVLADAINKFGSMGSKAATASSRLNEMEKAFMEFGMAYKEMTAAERATPAGQATIRSLTQLKQNIITTKQQMQDLQKQISIGGGGASFGGKFMSYMIPGFGLGAGAVAAMELVRAIRLVKDITEEAIKTNMEFEQSNANLAAVLGKTVLEINSLTQNAEHLGATTLFTANQITELQTVLARRGFDEGQILQMTKDISNLAVATGTDLAQSAELAASTMQAFGMQASEMGRITSVLGVSTTKSALTTDKLATSLQYVAPTARAAGYSLEDTVAMLGTLTDAGLDASIAGTSLRQIIMAMSTENGKLARSLGHPVRGLEGFKEALEHVSNAEDLLSDASKDVRITAVPALISLVNNKEHLEELRGEIENVGGALQDMADKQTNTLQGSVTLLKSAWNGLMLSFKQSTGPIKDVVDGLRELISEWAKVRNLNNGNYSLLENGVSDYQQRKLRDQVDKRIESGMAGSSIINGSKGQIAKYEEEKKKGAKLWDAWQKSNYAVSQENYRKTKAEIARFLGVDANDISSADLAKKYNEKMSGLSDNIAQHRYVIGYVEGKTPKTVNNNENQNPNPNGAHEPKTKAKTKAEIAEENVASGIEKYWENITIAGERLKSGLDTEAQYNQKMISAEEALYHVYANASYIVGGTNEDYKNGMDKCVSALNGYGRETAEIERMKNEEKEIEREVLQMLRQRRAVDNKTLNGLISSVKPAGKILGEGTDIMQYFGLSGIKSRMDANIDLDIADQTWKDLEDSINEKLKALGLDPIHIDVETGNIAKLTNEGKLMSEAWQYASQTISSVSSALGNIETPAAKVLTIIAEGIASMVAGYGAAVAQKGKDIEPWSWIAFTASAGATLISSIAAIKSATAEYHANGGIVGNPFIPKGTDTVPAMLTPGEEVLTANDPRHIRNIGMGGGSNPYVSGEMIFLGINNYLRRTGRGEIVTSR